MKNGHFQLNHLPITFSMCFKRAPASQINEEKSALIITLSRDKATSFKGLSVSPNTKLATKPLHPRGCPSVRTLNSQQSHYIQGAVRQSVHSFTRNKATTFRGLFAGSETAAVSP